MADAPVLIIACGALAKELIALQDLNGWVHIKVQCLPAELHNRPEKIPGAVRAQLEKYKDAYEHLFVAYADCGTGGALDAVLRECGVERLPGAHCYEFFAGSTAFEELSTDEPATFYLTDFLARHFDRLVKAGLGLDRNPELMSLYFGNYKRVVYLSQTRSEKIESRARACAKFLGLRYEHRHTGLGQINDNIGKHIVQWQKD